MAIQLQFENNSSAQSGLQVCRFSSAQDEDLVHGVPHLIKGHGGVALGWHCNYVPFVIMENGRCECDLSNALSSSSSFIFQDALVIPMSSKNLLTN